MIDEEVQFIDRYSPEFIKILEDVMRGVYSKAAGICDALSEDTRNDTETCHRCRDAILSRLK